jgi:hypothetical protein
MSKRKITYHIFKFYENGNLNHLYEDFNFDGFTEFINNIEDINKRFQINDTKFCSIDFIEAINPRYFQGRTKCYFGCIKSATFGTKKDLLDSLTNSERENPKSITEGEKEENYFVLAFNGNSEFEIIYQNAQNGITSNQFKSYLDKFILKYLTSIEQEMNFSSEIGDIIIENPEEIIGRLDRIVECKVYVDKEVLGSQFLNFTERTLNIKENLVVDIRADFKQSIVEVARDLIQNIVHNNRISKIWVRGKDNDNNETKFFIERIMKSKYIDVTLDPNKKSIVKSSIKTELINLI